MSADLTEYFAGTKLYGDDFSLEEIAAWFKDEAEAYPDRRASGGSTYAFTELNHHHGYRFLSGQPIDHALGLGGATGDELLPIIRSVRRITILDPSVPAAADELAGGPCRWVKPPSSGDAREPITSMGDWRRPRIGMTKRERGIPVKVFHDIIAKTRFRIRHRTLCVFPVVTKLASKARVAAFNSRVLTTLDSMASFAFSWNDRYHRTRWFQKLGPQSVCFVLEK